MSKYIQIRGNLGLIITFQSFIHKMRQLGTAFTHPDRHGEAFIISLKQITWKYVT